MQLETNNLRQLEQLNQRGGRMLSIVGLILFVHVIPEGKQPLRRVLSFWHKGPAGHRQIFRWNRATDACS